MGDASEERKANGSSGNRPNQLTLSSGSRSSSSSTNQSAENTSHGQVSMAAMSRNGASIATKNMFESKQQTSTGATPVKPKMRPAPLSLHVSRSQSSSPGFTFPRAKTPTSPSPKPASPKPLSPKTVSPKPVSPQVATPTSKLVSPGGKNVSKVGSSRKMSLDTSKAANNNQRITSPKVRTPTSPSPRMEFGRVRSPSPGPRTLPLSAAARGSPVVQGVATRGPVTSGVAPSGSATPSMKGPPTSPKPKSDPGKVMSPTSRNSPIGTPVKVHNSTTTPTVNSGRVTSPVVKTTPTSLNSISGKRPNSAGQKTSGTHSLSSTSGRRPGSAGPKTDVPNGSALKSSMTKRPGSAGLRVDVSKNHARSKTPTSPVPVSDISQRNLDQVEQANSDSKGQNTRSRASNVITGKLKPPQRPNSATVPRANESRNARGRSPNPGKGQGPNPITGKDRGVSPNIRKDRGRSPNPGMDRGYSPITGKDRGLSPSTVKGRVWGVSPSAVKSNNRNVMQNTNTSYMDKTTNNVVQPMRCNDTSEYTDNTETLHKVDENANKTYISESHIIINGGLDVINGLDSLNISEDSELEFSLIDGGSESSGTQKRKRPTGKCVCLQCVVSVHGTVDHIAYR